MDKKMNALSLLSIFLSLCLSLFSSGFLYHISETINHIENKSYVYTELSIVVILAILAYVFSILHSLVFYKLQKKYLIKIRMDYLTNHYIEFYLNNNDTFVETNVSILMNDASDISHLFEVKLGLVEKTINMLVYFVMLIAINWLLGLVLIFLTIVGGLSLLITGKKYSKLNEIYHNSIAQYESSQNEYAYAKNLIHHTDFLLNRTSNFSSKMCKNLYNFRKYRSKIVALCNAISNLSLIILFITLIIVYTKTPLLSLVFISFEYFEITLFSIKEVIIDIDDILSSKDIKAQYFAKKENEKEFIKPNNFNSIEIIDFETAFLRNRINFTIYSKEKNTYFRK